MPRRITYNLCALSDLRGEQKEDPMIIDLDSHLREGYFQD